MQKQKRSGFFRFLPHPEERKSLFLLRSDGYRRRNSLFYRKGTFAEKKFSFSDFPYGICDFPQIEIMANNQDKTCFTELFYPLYGFLLACRVEMSCHFIQKVDFPSRSQALFQGQLFQLALGHGPPVFVRRLFRLFSFDQAAKRKVFLFRKVSDKVPFLEHIGNLIFPDPGFLGLFHRPDISSEVSVFPIKGSVQKREDIEKSRFPGAVFSFDKYKSFIGAGKRDVLQNGYGGEGLGKVFYFNHL